MRLLSAVVWGSFEFAVLWAEAKTVLIGYVIPVVVSIGVIRIIQVITHQIKGYFEPRQPIVNQNTPNEQKAN